MLWVVSSRCTSMRHCIAFALLAQPVFSLMTSSLPDAKVLPDLDTLAATANSYASSHGLLVERSGGHFQAAPMSLLPNVFPSAAFEQATSLAPLWNVLVDRISRDSDFLQGTLGGDVSDADPFTAKLLRLYVQLYPKGGSGAEPSSMSSPSSWAPQADRFNIHRGDYMLHPSDDAALPGTSSSSSPPPTQALALKQIELNTIAASFASLACRTAQLHSYLTARFDCDSFLRSNEDKVVGRRGSPDDARSGGLRRRGVPPNPTLTALPHAMKLAVDRYRDRFGVADCVVLFVVQPGETNTVDQRMLEFELFDRHGISVVRLSLAECQARVALQSGSGALVLDGKDEIALVYFRAGYAPTDYPSGDTGAEWRARELLENSRATKAPSLGYHLAGTKKVQQALARPGAVERYFDDSPDDAAALRECFAGLWSLGQDASDDDLSAVRRVLEGQQAKFVLKPQREGGGYNFYGDKMLEKLRAHVSVDEDGGRLVLDKTLGEYILMERLFPPAQTSILLRGGVIEGSGETVSELGCYGTILVSFDGKEVLHNEYAGFLLRTKFESVDEGGVASGFATLSSPYLV